mgnify:CR=1 FL=1
MTIEVFKMSIHDFLDGDQTPESVTPADATLIETGSDFYDEPVKNTPDDTAIYPETVENEISSDAAIASLESIREDLTGLVRDTQTAVPQTEFIVDVDLDDDSKTLLDKDLTEIIAADPEVMESLESISLLDERSVNTIIGIIDDKLESLKAK